MSNNPEPNTIGWLLKELAIDRERGNQFDAENRLRKIGELVEEYHLNNPERKHKKKERKKARRHQKMAKVIMDAKVEVQKSKQALHVANINLKNATCRGEQIMKEIS